jgi:hypothetical protein
MYFSCLPYILYVPPIHPPDLITLIIYGDVYITPITNDRDFGPQHKKLPTQEEHSRQPQPTNQTKPLEKHVQLKETKIKTDG